MKANHSICTDCGMVVSPGEYHPFAACLMFKACHDGDQVRANLDAVRLHSAQQDADKVDSQPHYVIRFDEEINGSPSDVYGLVRVDEWNNGLSRAIANLINHEDGDPIVVYTAPARTDPAMAGDEGMPPLDDRATYSAEHVRTLIRIDRSRQRVQPASGEARE